MEAGGAHSRQQLSGLPVDNRGWQQGGELAAQSSRCLQGDTGSPRSLPPCRTRARSRIHRTTQGCRGDGAQDVVGGLREGSGTAGECGTVGQYLRTDDCTWGGLHGCSGDRSGAQGG